MYKIDRRGGGGGGSKNRILGQTLEPCCDNFSFFCIIVFFNFDCMTRFKTPVIRCMEINVYQSIK